MNTKKHPCRILIFSLLGGSALLVGCATPKTLYQWERYQPQVYEYFNGQGKGFEAQISTLEEDLEKIRAKGNTPPPGYHAHLGLLYLQIGKNDRVAQELGAEKELYPDSATSMNFLLKKLTK